MNDTGAGILPLLVGCSPEIRYRHLFNTSNVQVVHLLYFHDSVPFILLGPLVSQNFPFKHISCPSFAKVDLRYSDIYSFHTRQTFRSTNSHIGLLERWDQGLKHLPEIKAANISICYSGTL